MSEIEKMKRYIERTKADRNGKFSLTTTEVVELALQVRNSDDFPLEALSLAFDYGKAKGYRAAKAEGRAQA